MAGTPAAGKSTLAEALGRATRAIVVDHDVVKSALLHAGVDWGRAGPAAYESDFALARELLRQGHSVILDSACHHAEIPAKGASIADELGARYLFIECLCPDDDELARRRQVRPRRRSQLAGATAFSPDAADYAPSQAEVVDHLRWRTHRPRSELIEVDMTRPIEDILVVCLKYVRAEGMSASN
jgi:predicted kinase